MLSCRGLENAGSSQATSTVVETKLPTAQADVHAPKPQPAAATDASLRKSGYPPEHAPVRVSTPRSAPQSGLQADPQAPSEDDNSKPDAKVVPPADRSADTVATTDKPVAQPDPVAPNKEEGDARLPSTDDMGLRRVGFPKEYAPVAASQPEHSTAVTDAGLRSLAPKVTPAAPPPSSIGKSGTAATTTTKATLPPRPNPPSSARPAAPPAAAQAAPAPSHQPRTRVKRGPPPQQVHITRDLGNVGPENGKWASGK